MKIAQEAVGPRTRSSRWCSARGPRATTSTPTCTRIQRVRTICPRSCRRGGARRRGVGWDGPRVAQARA
jgi:hypothetical protein